MSTKMTEVAAASCAVPPKVAPSSPAPRSELFAEYLLSVPP